MSTPAQYGTVRNAIIRRPCPLMLGGMIRRPCGCEYVYGSSGAVKVCTAGETAIAESCGLGCVDGVLPYVVGSAGALEGGARGV